MLVVVEKVRTSSACAAPNVPKNIAPATASTRRIAARPIRGGAAPICRRRRDNAKHRLSLRKIVGELVTELRLSYRVHSRLARKSGISLIGHNLRHGTIVGLSAAHDRNIVNADEAPRHGELRDAVILHPDE